VWSTHQSASRIESSFNCHRTVSTNNFSTIFNSMTMKENEHRNIERVSAYASFVESFFKQQDDDEWKNVQSYQDITEDHWEIYSFDKVIKLSKELLKFKLLKDSNEIKTTANYMKNTEHTRCMKWISETQWS